MSPAASYAQWRSASRLERKLHGEDCSMESLYSGYYEAVNDYVHRWQEVQDNVEEAYREQTRAAEAKKKGGGKDSEK